MFFLSTRIHSADDRLPYIQDGSILLGDIIESSSLDGMAVLQARDEAQMTGSAGDLLDFGDEKQGFIVWARPPVYFVQVLPDMTTGVLPRIEQGCDVRLPLLPDIDIATVTQSLRKKEVTTEAAESTTQQANDERHSIAPTLEITVGKPKLGRITNYLDQPLDELGPVDPKVARSLPVFNVEPEKGSTESLSRGLATGIISVDVLTPLGRGQTMLVTGPNGVGRKDLALDAVQAQKSDVACVWACMRGQGKLVKNQLEGRGAMSNTAILEAPLGSPPSIQYATAAAALAVAEGIRNEGGDSLVILDDISELSSFWDDTTRVLLNLLVQILIITNSLDKNLRYKSYVILMCTQIWS